MAGEQRCSASAIASAASGPLRDDATLSPQTGGKTVDGIRNSAAQWVRAVVPERFGYLEWSVEFNHAVDGRQSVCCAILRYRILRTSRVSGAFRPVAAARLHDRPMAGTRADPPLDWLRERQQLGLSGRWPPFVATTAMVCSAVAEVVNILRGFFQSWPDAGVAPERCFVAL